MAHKSWVDSLNVLVKFKEINLVWNLGKKPGFQVFIFYSGSLHMENSSKSIFIFLFSSSFWVLPYCVSLNIDDYIWIVVFFQVSFRHWCRQTRYFINIWKNTTWFFQWKISPTLNKILIFYRMYQLEVCVKLPRVPDRCHTSQIKCHSLLIK